MNEPFQAFNVLSMFLALRQLKPYGFISIVPVKNNTYRFITKISLRFLPLVKKLAVLFCFLFLPPILFFLVEQHCLLEGYV